MSSNRNRGIVDLLFRSILYLSLVLFLGVIACLLSIVIIKGVGDINLTFLTHTAMNISEVSGGGGILHAFIGTMEQGLLALLISTPLAIIVSIFMDRYRSRKIVAYLYISVNLLSTLPTIIVSLLVSEIFMQIFGLSFSGMLGAIALAITMFPILVSGIHDNIYQIDRIHFQSGISLGLHHYKVYWKIILPMIRLSLIDYMLLAFSRGVGETAPVRILIFGSPELNLNIFNGPQSSLTSYIYDNASSPYKPLVDQAWSAALVLIIVMLLVVFIAQVVFKRLICKNI